MHVRAGRRHLRAGEGVEILPFNVLDCLSSSFLQAISNSLVGHGRLHLHCSGEIHSHQLQMVIRRNIREADLGLTRWLTTNSSRTFAMLEAFRSRWVDLRPFRFEFAAMHSMRANIRPRSQSGDQRSKRHELPQQFLGGSFEAMTSRGQSYFNSQNSTLCALSNGIVESLAFMLLFQISK